MTFFIELKQIIIKHVWHYKRPWISKATLGNKRKARYTMLSELKLYHKTMVIRMVWYLHKNKHTDQWNREGIEINPWTYSQIIWNNRKDNKMGLGNCFIRGTRKHDSCCCSLKSDVKLFVTQSVPGFSVSTVSRVCSNSYPLSQWYYLTSSFSASPLSFCL